MKKTSIASLQERLSGWTDWDQATYHLGACLGFWPEFGAPGDATGPFDPWHGTKDTIHGPGMLSAALRHFIEDLLYTRCLEKRINEESGMIQYRWDPKYKGMADLMSVL